MQPSPRLFGFPRPRARTLAGFVAGMLFASQVLAAAGLCAVKSPAVAPAMEVVIAEACDDADHLASLERTAFEPAKSAESGPHCSSEDPSAQARTADLPGGSTQALAALPAPVSFLPFSHAAWLPIADAGPPLRPLYARLNRLLL